MLSKKDLEQASSREIAGKSVMKPRVFANIQLATIHHLRQRIGFHRVVSCHLAKPSGNKLSSATNSR
jgi:hypothetical protein